jgi:hypothetical protein
MADTAARLFWATDPPTPTKRRPPPVGRLEASPEDVERGLAQLVLTLVEFVRQLMERQAIRRMESATLTPEQEENLGIALMRLAEKMDELKEQFGLDDDDLNLSLGPLGDLL